MKNEAQRIGDQLKRAFDGEAWHGPALMESLEGITVAQAVARPIASAHTIWELVAHIEAWESVVARRLDGELLMEPTEDFPKAPATANEADWQALVEVAGETHSRLVAQVGALTDDDLR